MYCNIYQHLAKPFTLHSEKHKQITSDKNKSHNKSRTFYLLYVMYLKHWKTFETTLTMKSNYLLEKLALSLHPESSCLINVIFFIVQSSNKNFLKILINFLQSFFQELSLKRTAKSIQDGVFWNYSRLWEGRGPKRSLSLKSVTHILHWWNLDHYTLPNEALKNN